jgi:hypothetical protein
VHIPFCESLCFYCACNKIVTKHHERAAEYLRYLTREVDLHISKLGQGQTISQLHLGGGTPTFFSDDELEELMAKVDASQKRLAKIPVILKRFRQSVLAAACSGRLTADWREENPTLIIVDQALEEGLPDIPESWNWVKLPETGEMNRGKSRHRPRNHPSLFGGPYPFIQTGDIAQSGGKIISHKQTYSKKGLEQSRLWPAGTVCITIAANIAESALLTYPACFPDSVVGILANPKKAVAEYVEFFIRVAKADLSTFAPATAQKNINIAILNEVAVPLPPLPEQQEIVRRVESFFTLADQLEARYLKAKTHVDKLTQSILLMAFQGKLVPQDPDDEPASVLLERILSQKESAPKTRKTNIESKEGAVKESQKRQVKTVASEPTPVGGQIELSKIARQILRFMKRNREYSKDEVVVPLVLSTGAWNSAIRELKEACLVVQTGDKRGASYHKI